MIKDENVVPENHNHEVKLQPILELHNPVSIVSLFEHTRIPVPDKSTPELEKILYHFPGSAFIAPARSSSLTVLKAVLRYYTFVIFHQQFLAMSQGLEAINAIEGISKKFNESLKVATDGLENAKIKADPAVGPISSTLTDATTKTLEAAAKTLGTTITIYTVNLKLKRIPSKTIHYGTMGLSLTFLIDSEQDLHFLYPRDLFLQNFNFLHEYAFKDPQKATIPQWATSALTTWIPRQPETESALQQLENVARKVTSLSPRKEPPASVVDLAQAQNLGALPSVFQFVTNLSSSTDKAFLSTGPSLSAISSSTETVIYPAGTPTSSGSASFVSAEGRLFPGPGLFHSQHNASQGPLSSAKIDPGASLPIRKTDSQIFSSTAQKPKERICCCCKYPLRFGLDQPRDCGHFIHAVCRVKRGDKCALCNS